MEKAFETLRWIGLTDGVLELLDQRKLPGRMDILICRTPEQLFEAITTLAVRGAPAIGVAAAYGICLACREIPDTAPAAETLKTVLKTADYLAQSRPTAVNLFWALNRIKRTAQDFTAANPKATTGQLKNTLLAEAKTIETEDRQMCQAIGQHGQQFIPDNATILTHCNAGALATAGIGTALAPIYLAHAQGKKIRVYMDETRPLLQGARLTAWELTQMGIDAVLQCDNMAASLMKSRKIDAIIVGADRIAANGDTANKIGTLALSILAGHFGVPFYVAAPSSTFDLSIPDGTGIPIEHRRDDEVTHVAGCRVAPEQISVYNPAFDVTDHTDITAIVTERGVIEHPDAEKIRRHLL
ncbi:MAG: S-methyl-5-thioribose-1-phosphate isomerase [Anaerohalosphaeraceae bacterium]